jgi:hypothetical protein
MIFKNFPTTASGGHPNRSHPIEVLTPQSPDEVAGVIRSQNPGLQAQNPATGD